MAKRSQVQPLGLGTFTKKTFIKSTSKWILVTSLSGGGAEELYGSEVPALAGGPPRGDHGLRSPS